MVTNHTVENPSEDQKEWRKELVGNSAIVYFCPISDEVLARMPQSKTTFRDLTLCSYLKSKISIFFWNFRR